LAQWSKAWPDPIIPPRAEERSPVVQVIASARRIELEHDPEKWIPVPRLREAQ
jgi:hypothetical protein